MKKNIQYLNSLGLSEGSASICEAAFLAYICARGFLSQNAYGYINLFTALSSFISDKIDLSMQLVLRNCRANFVYSVCTH